MNGHGARRAGLAAGGMTLAELARGLDIDLREVSRTARFALGLAPAQARDRRFVLSPGQCDSIVAALEMQQQPSLIPPGDMDAGLRPRAGATASRGASAPRPRTLLPFQPDRLAQPHNLQFRGLRHGIWLHPEVSDHLREWGHLYRRLGIVLQHLAAHGRTTVVKGCRDENRGWRRSPLGGANGMQYYLWWTPRGSRVAKGLALPADAILVRAVRHHDDHAPLEAGSLDDYLALSAPDHLNDDIAGRPWTDAQIRFVEDERPVRLILGRPGSGKTTVLWKAVEARSGQRVLYLTWSSALTRHAEERFASFAPADVEVVARDFATFVGEICGADVARQALAASRTRFDAAITRLGRDMAGPWKNRRDALHAELRAVLFGRAVPGEAGCVVERGIARIGDDAYRDLRGDHEGVGAKSARALLKVARFLPADGVRAVFPELVAATRAIGRLRDHDDIPEGFDDFDRIVVDELQDLTLLETSVVVELCRAIGRRRGRAPWLLLAGDAGQTVRPTGFAWGPLNDLLARRVGTPARFHLEEHLRCPSRIAEVVERASERYVDLEKKVRPTKQRRQQGGQHVDAHLVYVHVPGRSEAVELLERLEEADEVVVLSARNEPPAWVPEHLRDSVLTPAEAKGLEYQSVCLLDAGPLLSHLGAEDQAYVTDAELDRQARRTAIDHLRVTLSRATETLVCIDVETPDEERELSLALLGDAAPYSPEDLLDHFAHADASPEERVQTRTNDARLLIDSAPGRAWQRARQAFRLLGDPDLPNGVSDRTVRLDARTTLLATAARLLVDGPPDGLQRHEVLETALEAVAADDPLADEPAPRAHPTGAGERPKENGPRGAEPPHPFLLAFEEEQTFRELAAWSVTRSAAPFPLLECAHRLDGLQRTGGDWLRSALLPAAQALREGLGTGAGEPESAACFADTEVEAWLRLTGYTGDAAARARALRGKAFDTLLKAAANEKGPARRKRLERAEALLATIAPDLPRLGRLREAQGRPEDAAAAYERAGARKDVLRVWRNAGAWERALELAQGDVRADLDWLIELERLVDRRPAQQNKRLRNGERDRLEKLLDAVQKRPPRKRGANGG